MALSRLTSHSSKNNSISQKSYWTRSQVGSCFQYNHWDCIKSAIWNLPSVLLLLQKTKKQRDRLFRSKPYTF